MSREQYVDTIASIGDRPLDDRLSKLLNAEFSRYRKTSADLKALCARGERAGWLMNRETGGIKFGRAVEPRAEAGCFSVDVGTEDTTGPHHIRTNGEIGAIVPIAGTPKFDAFDEGWPLSGPGSDRCPAVEGGDAHVLYLLPGGAVESTRR